MSELQLHSSPIKPHCVAALPGIEQVLNKWKELAS